MGARKRSEGGGPVKGIVTSGYCLELGEQKCLKARYIVIRCGQQDRAKKKNRGYKNQKKLKRQGIKTVRKALFKRTIILVGLS